jgi:hypothetical protein
MYLTFKAGVGIFDEPKAGFEGLQKDPQTGREEGDGPSNDPE